MSFLTLRRIDTASSANTTTLSRLLSVWRQRQHLGRLDSHALRDIGLSEADALRESRRKIWDVPANWRM